MMIPLPNLQIHTRCRLATVLLPALPGLATLRAQQPHSVPVPEAREHRDARMAGGGMPIARSPSAR